MKHGIRLRSGVIVLACRACHQRPATRYLPSEQKRSNYCDRCGPMHPDGRSLVPYGELQRLTEVQIRECSLVDEIVEGTTTRSNPEIERAVEAALERRGIAPAAGPPRAHSFAARHDDAAVERLLATIMPYDGAELRTIGRGIAAVQRQVALTSQYDGWAIRLSKELGITASDVDELFAKVLHRAKESHASAELLADGARAYAKLETSNAELRKLGHDIAEASKQARDRWLADRTTIDRQLETERRRVAELTADLAGATELLTKAKAQGGASPAESLGLLSHIVAKTVPGKNVFRVEIPAHVDRQFSELSSTERSKVSFAIQQYMTGRRPAQQIRGLDGLGRQRYGLMAGAYTLFFVTQSGGFLLDSIARGSLGEAMPS